MATRDIENPYNFFYLSGDVPQQTAVRLESIIGTVPAQLRQAWLRKQVAAADDRYWKASSETPLGKDDREEEDSSAHRDGHGSEERGDDDDHDDLSAENYVDILKLVAHEMDDGLDEEAGSPEIFLECQLWAGGIPLTLPKRTGLSEILPYEASSYSERYQVTQSSQKVSFLLLLLAKF